MAETTKSIVEKLSNIQQKIKCPKNLYNDYGKYNYRNAETILETVKPLLKEEGLTLILTDDIVSVGEVNFCKATARLIDIKSNDSFENVAFAQLSEHKGMSADQTTGCASSYARKYALNGLFLLDDVKDADSNEFVEESKSKENKQKAFTDTKKVEW